MSSKAPQLSLKTLHLTIGVMDSSCMPQVENSSNSCRKKMTLCRAVDRTINLASVVKSAMIGCNLLDQTMGQLAKETKTQCGTNTRWHHWWSWQRSSCQN